MSNRRQARPTICGPVKDGQFTVWVVRGPKGGQLGEFFTREAARKFLKKHLKPRRELLHATR